MSWKDSAEPVTTAPPPATSGGSTPAWMQNAEPATNQDSGDYWGDVKRNAIEGVKEIPKAAQSIFQTAKDVSIPNIASNAVKSVTAMSNGTPYSDTPIAASNQRVLDFGKGAAQGVWQGVKDAGAAVAMVPQMMTGTPARSTIFGRDFRERPLSATANVLGAAGAAKNLFMGGAEGAATGAAEGSAGAASEGAATATSDLPVVQDIPKTGKPVAVFDYNDPVTGKSSYKLGGDPAQTGIKTTGNVPFEQLPEGTQVVGKTAKAAQLGHQPLDNIQGAVSQAPGDITRIGPANPLPSTPPPASPPGYLETQGTKGLSSLMGLSDQTIKKLTPRGQNPATVGASVLKQFSDEDAIGSTAAQTFDKVNKNFKAAGKARGAALQAVKDANQSMGTYPELTDPLKVEATSVLKPVLDEANQMMKSGYEKQAAGYMKRIYNNLQDAANENDGNLTLDMIENERQQVGKMFNAASAGSDKWKMASHLYSTVADIEDSMINNIADATGNSKLASNLKAANAKYSRYARVMPDVTNNAARSVTGNMTMGSMFDQLKNAVFTGPTASRMAAKAGSMFKGK